MDACSDLRRQIGVSECQVSGCQWHRSRRVPSLHLRRRRIRIIVFCPQPPVFLSQTGSLSMTVPFRSHLTQNAITAAALRLPVSGTTLAGFENLSARFSQEPTDHQGAHPAFLSALTFFRDDRRHRVFGAARNHERSEKCSLNRSTDQRTFRAVTLRQAYRMPQQIPWISSQAPEEPAGCRGRFSGFLPQSSSQSCHYQERRAAGCLAGYHLTAHLNRSLPATGNQKNMG